MDVLKDWFVAPAVLVATWLASFEWRLRNKPNHRECNSRHDPMTEQLTRLESHIWDIMKAQNIRPTTPPPRIILENEVNHHSSEERYDKERPAS